MSTSSRTHVFMLKYKTSTSTKYRFDASFFRDFNPK